MTKRKVVRQQSSWLRDRDLLGAWAFRLVSSALLGLVIYMLKGYAADIDEVKKEVPVLSNTVAALTNQMRGEQDQINKLWDRLFDNLAQKNNKK